LATQALRFIVLAEKSSPRRISRKASGGVLFFGGWKMPPEPPVKRAVAYVDGAVHTNTLENFWSLFAAQHSGNLSQRRTIHLFRHLDEQAFRYNNRKGLDDAGRFDLALSKVIGKRLTFADVTGENHDPETWRN
jgi:hypothetical protein